MLRVGAAHYADGEALRVAEIEQKKMNSRLTKLALALLLLAPLCVPGTARASSITEQQMSADLATVEVDITHNPMSFLKSSIAQKDLNAGIAAMTTGELDAARGNTKGAQAAFAAAIQDFNGVLKVLGDAPLDPPSNGVPEPSSVVLLGLGATLLLAARGMKNYREQRQRAEMVPAT